MDSVHLQYLQAVTKFLKWRARQVPPMVKEGVMVLNNVWTSPSVALLTESANHEGSLDGFLVANPPLSITICASLTSKKFPRPGIRPAASHLNPRSNCSLITLSGSM
jgi:hypothetical protein